MKIRLATMHDRERVLKLLNQLGEVINEFVCFDRNNTRAHIVGKHNYETAMHRSDRKVFVVEEHGKILAAATYFILTDFITANTYAHIDDFVVDRKRRRQGIGTKLIAYIKAYAKRHGMSSLELTTSLPLSDAHRFYEKNSGIFARKVYKFPL